MLRRTRTTKKLARRIDLQYFTRPHAFRRWRFWLSVAVPVIVLGWLLAQRAQGGQKVYSSGPLSHSHAVFSKQCILCHVTRAGVFSEHVTDQACLTCHDGPQHHTNQTFTPQCSGCHVEHTGALRLASTSEASCTQCHTSLKTHDGPPHYAASIDSFDNDHPEFSPLRPGQTDTGRIKLNHYLHLQPNLIGPRNQRVQMTCDDCHRAATGGSWPYAAPDIRDVADKNSGDSQARMVRPAFSKHCAACHTLEFDHRFENEQVPHDNPEVVHAFLLKRFGEYIAAHPAAVHEVEIPNRQLPERMRSPRIARSPSEWIQFRAEETEWLLWTKTCKQCHLLNLDHGPLPVVAESNIPVRWLPHAEFDHMGHRMMTCTACHARAPDSRETADILLPGIETCRQCHLTKGPAREAAEGRCFECHQYHDWAKAARTKGRFTIPELRGIAHLTQSQN